MGECRNCGAKELRDLGFIGEIAPFFLRRVMGCEYGFPPSPRPLKRLLREIPFLSGVLKRVYGKSVLVEMQICAVCSFIQTEFPFQDEAIAKLYADYRSDSYNRERITYEPEYAAIASQIGSSPQEIEARTLGLTEWLKTRIKLENQFSMLDYGGADGKFLPKLPGEKYVYDISDMVPAHGIVRITDESALGRYSYIQLAHVLEHVSRPLILTKKAASFLKDSGYLYVEVPQDLSGSVIARLFERDKNICLPIHEHINQYSVKSVTELLRAAGLACEAVKSEVMDLGWSKATIIRGLARKC